MSARRPRCSPAFDAVATTGAPELVLVSGYSGSRQERFGPRAAKADRREAGYFISGKFDQYKRDIPYATLAQAFRGLVRQILGESDTRIAEWRDTLRGGAWPERPAHGQSDPRARARDRAAAAGAGACRRSRRRTVSRWCSGSSSVSSPRPSTRWCSSSTTCSGWMRGRWLCSRTVVTHPDVHHLLLVGAYRDNEVDPSHPLIRTLEAIRKEGGIIHDVVLNPLSQNDVAKIIAEALQISPRGPDRFPSWSSRRPTAIRSSPSSS